MGFREILAPSWRRRGGSVGGIAGLATRLSETVEGSHAHPPGPGGGDVDGNKAPRKSNMDPLGQLRDSVGGDAQFLAELIDEYLLMTPTPAGVDACGGQHRRRGRRTGARHTR